jgi:hypothetical protein
MSGMSVKSRVPLDKVVGRRIRARRLQLGLSQRALGEALGISYQQVQKYEQGVSRIPPRSGPWLHRSSDADGRHRPGHRPGHVAAKFQPYGQPYMRLHIPSGAASCRAAPALQGGSREPLTDYITLASLFFGIPTSRPRHGIGARFPSKR